MSKRLGAIEHERGFMKLGASSSRQTERLLWLMVHGTCKKVSPNTINQCYHLIQEGIYYYYGSFGILSYQHYLGSPFSYRGHRAFGTVAVSIVLSLLIYCGLRCNFMYECTRMYMSCRVHVDL